MAPEVSCPNAADGAFSERADVYSLACVAYELFTGRRPFLAEGTWS